jgi:ABC-type sugar transport system permease subunit
MQTVETGAGTQPKKRTSSRMRQRHIQNAILVAPQLVLFVSLTIIPLFVAIPFLFTNMSNFNDPQVDYIGVDNFTRLFTDSDLQADYWPALGKTVRFTILNYAMVYAFGLTLALLMYEIGFKGGLFTVIYLPWMISGLALGFMALLLFSEATGSVNLLLKELGWIETPFKIKSEQGTTTILPVLVGWKAAGFNLAIFLAGLLSIPRETVEAAIVDGASYWQRLFYVYFPQMVPSFIIATIYALLGSFKVFDELVAMGGLYHNKSAAFLSIVFFKYGFSQNKLALAMTLSVQTFLPLMLIAILLQQLQRRLTRYQN